MKKRWILRVTKLVSFVAAAVIVGSLIHYPMGYVVDHFPPWVTGPVFFFLLVFSVWLLIRDSVRTLVQEEITKGLNEVLYGDEFSDGFQENLTRNIVEAMDGDVDAFDERLAERYRKRQAAYLAEIAQKYGGAKK
jgi:hypothetical protein